MIHLCLSRSPSRCPSLSLYLSNHLSIYLHLHLHLHLYLYLYLYLSIYLPIYLSVCLSIYPSIHLSDCLFFCVSISELSKVAGTRFAFHILTSKCASFPTGVHFFDISTSKCGPNMWCFLHVRFDMCFAPQPRALYFQKCTEAEVFLTI